MPRVPRGRSRCGGEGGRCAHAVSKLLRVAVETGCITLRYEPEPVAPHPGARRIWARAPVRHPALKRRPRAARAESACTRTRRTRSSVSTRQPHRHRSSIRRARDGADFPIGDATHDSAGPLWLSDRGRDRPAQGDRRKCCQTDRTRNRALHPNTSQRRERTMRSLFPHVLDAAAIGRCVPGASSARGLQKVGRCDHFLCDRQGRALQPKCGHSEAREPNSRQSDS